MTTIRENGNAAWIAALMVVGGGGTTFGIVQTGAANDAHRTSVSNIESLRDDLRNRDERLENKLGDKIDELAAKVNDLTTEVAKLKGTVEALKGG